LNQTLRHCRKKLNHLYPNYGQTTTRNPLTIALKKLWTGSNTVFQILQTKLKPSQTYNLITWDEPCMIGETTLSSPTCQHT
jgi:hypothetical protein